jgi:cytochrome P450
VWPEPERFDPDRFAPERSEGRPRFTYFPFAGGPRQCIGSEFAMTEATLALATIARRYRLELVPKRKVLPQASITLRPRGGLPMIPHAAGIGASASARSARASAPTGTVTPSCATGTRQM